jgi:hypothetical protein
MDVGHMRGQVGFGYVKYWVDGEMLGKQQSQM